MSQANELEWLMLDLINAERTDVGLQPLQLDLRLNESSEDHSSWMLAADTFSHTGVGGSNAGARMRDAEFTFSGSWGWGENIAWQSERGAAGLADDVANLHDALMNSSGHRANILRPGYEAVGIGIEYGDFRGWDAVMVTQNFAYTAAALQPDAPGGSGEVPTPLEPGNTAPELFVEDVTLARISGERNTKLKDLVTYSDADGDKAVWYEFLDGGGRDNFRFNPRKTIDATTPYRLDAEDLRRIEVAVEWEPGTTVLYMRASDGTDVSDWAEFTLTTLSARDWLELG